MSLKLQIPNVTELKPRISVIGVGGAGGNAINNMIESGVDGVEFIAANTDAQALATSAAEHQIQLGVNLTEGLGAGSRPEVGEAAAEEALDEIRAQLSGSHMVFVAAGMGGGTGTGAASVIARIAQEIGVLTVGIVTKPFHFEGNRRMRVAEAGIAELSQYVDTLIVIPNQNLFRIANEKTTFAEAFILADQVLHAGISCITDLIVREGLINLDFADVRAIMLDMGAAMMGTGEAAGDRRAVEAAEMAIANPLLDEISMRGAKGLLVSISGSKEMTLYEVDEAASRVREEADPEANIIVGATFDDTLTDKIRVSIVASGLTGGQAHQPTRARTGAEPPARASNEGPDLARRLSDAIRGAAFGASAAPVPDDNGANEVAGHPRREPAGGGAAAPRGRAAHPRTAPARKALSESLRINQDDNWAEDPDEVTIELGPPSLISPARNPKASPSGATPGSRGSKATRQFAPEPPTPVQRKPNRMPEVQDFPAIAQKEYHAKKDGDRTGATPAPKKRVRLFDRLTGRLGDGPEPLPTRPEGHPEAPNHQSAAEREIRQNQHPSRRPAAGEGDFPATGNDGEELGPAQPAAPKFFRR